MTVIIADDHPFTLEGTKFFVQRLGHNVIDTASNGITALNIIRTKKPVIAILDINMPGLDGLDIAKAVQEEGLPTKIIFLTMHKETTIFNKAVALGAFGYVLKEHALDELEESIKACIRNEVYISLGLQSELETNFTNASDLLDKLSFSERKIIALIAQNKTSKQIAETLFLSEKTVEGHRSRIIEKLGIPKEKNALLSWVMSHKESIK